MEGHFIPYQRLKEIANNFSQKNDAPGFGSFCKGVLPNGEMVAVKSLSLAMLVPQKLFENEFYRLARLKHPNVVRFIGYCCGTFHVTVQCGGMYLCIDLLQSPFVLEYLPKGSLDRYLTDESSGLDWRTRYKIIKGVCYGLHYLHENNNPIVHFDLEPKNILLDDNTVPKIIGFGLSKLLNQQTSHVSTSNGTWGYTAPEYLHLGDITPKSHIFSLGAIIMEVVTGHRDYPSISGASPKDFIELELQKWRSALEKVLEYKLQEIDCLFIKRCMEIGIVCLNPEQNQKPTITNVIKMLHGFESTFFHGIDEIRSAPHHLPLQRLKEMTDNFSDEKIIGTGGFGVVYKGKLQNGKMVAVKKLVHSMASSRKQFENEVDLLMRLNHPNIVQLLGYCYETHNLRTPYNGKFVFAEETKSLLCLEYLPKGSLEKYISEAEPEFGGHEVHGDNKKARFRLEISSIEVAPSEFASLAWLELEAV